ncbi:pentapeptide repeat-containing protein [Dolichospermum circinale CS-534/05]|uniref:pentapeptide repeat-containing protein n=1 Tax=Dolichospermum circinale TaxID=109265 RepID=UPI00232F5906|nr:pentapeptide repeat-containing protein [Dolichospermum circinale]MDB9453245.1 pentapeptide repeat-containing protein [Dolichospermum circinale CS-541/06]MDB9462641.1 pentapeptide repeat-containing protein [Dolichospermum circinale CS-541/04]MDB9491249.1 pentapeptide repeat-containing protein [Dolichospermum circinale CS-534/05]MDB9545882.1 pentapeptide repeat-containing protein [Dolichospermum circinale CS-1031]
MTINESDSSHLSSPQINQEDELEITESNQSLTKVEPDKKQVSAQSSLKTSIFKEISALFSANSSIQVLITPRILLFTSLSMAITLISIVINNSWLGILGTLATLLLSLLILYPWWQDIIRQWFAPEDRKVFVGLIGLIVAIIGLFRFANLGHSLLLWGKRINWEASGTLAEWFGALGQIAIAIIAVYVAWRQYVISKDLTIQQNLLTVQQNVITQQQTIDSYFQGVSDLILDEEGLLEDWPQERAIAEGRTAAIFSSVDGSGKAKILRFLSRSKLLTPLQRDRRLGRAILDGSGGYAEDRLEGVRVIDLGVMLAGADLADNDLRWTDLSEANLVRANLSNCDLVKANLSRTILYEANLSNTDLNGVRLFYGLVEQASPRSRTQPPNYETGEHTGAVIENADFTNAQRMSPATHYYCCAWCGEKTRNTIPGGCEGIPNKLGR